MHNRKGTSSQFLNHSILNMCLYLCGCLAQYLVFKHFNTLESAVLETDLWLMEVGGSNVYI